MESLQQLFRSHTGESPQRIEELPSSGSNRRYFRIEGATRSLIGVKGSCAEENRAFWYLARHFAERGIAVPRVFAHSDDFLTYLQENLGDELLFDRVAPGRERGIYSEREKELLRETIRQLPRIQYEGARGLDFSRCYPQPSFDRRMVAFDQNYFKYCFLKATGIDFDEIALDDDFAVMQEVMTAEPGETFLYRDFQSRNVMLVDDRPYFIDFQGGRRGPVHYDVASFVWQARAGYDEALRADLVEQYIEAARQYTEINREAFLERLRHFVLFRTLQVLGAYGFRGYFEKKPHFLQSIPYAVANLRQLLVRPFPEYPCLNGILERLTQMREYAVTGAEQLEVEITSFAFKKGIPADASGNGGGYVFDCRGLDNPGKYEHYRHFTGQDREVIDFLEERGEVHDFLSHIFPIAEAHVQRYIERKFTHLMFSFGCTGGQHRSVYCAERLSRHLSHRFAGIRIVLRHRELGTEHRP